MSSLKVTIAVSVLMICGYLLIVLRSDCTNPSSYVTPFFQNNGAIIPGYRSLTPVLAQPHQRGIEQRHILRMFDINKDGSDVLVFLRIQKTGSTTLSRHLSKDIDVSPYCNCSGADSKCPCYQEWMRHVLFAYYTPFPCGLHADWTHLRTCVEGYVNRRHHRRIPQRHLYITMVREPLRRYLSEWLHVNWIATWRGAPLKCGGRSATLAEVPPCYTTYNWAGVSMRDFMNCSSNLAINRQTRMLADLTLVNCYNTSGMSYEDRHYKMVKSMAYFGLTEHQELSQIMFENTFNLKFRKTFLTSTQKAYSRSANVTEETKRDILYMNRYDVMLYNFAKELFHERALHLIHLTKDMKLKRRLQTLINRLWQR